MADTKISNLTALGTLSTDDLFAVVDDPGGTPLSRKATGTQVKNFVWTAPVTASFEDATTNTVVTNLDLQRTSSAAPANGIGVAQTFTVETAAANNEIGYKISVSMTDNTSTTEDFTVLQQAMSAGALVDQLSFRGLTNDIVCWRPLFWVFNAQNAATAILITNSDTGASAEASIAFQSGTGANVTFKSLHTFANNIIDATIGDLSFKTAANEDMKFTPGAVDAGFMSGANQRFGWGTQSPDRQFHVEQDTATTNAVTYVERLTSTSSGTPANNIGVGVEYEVETAAANNEIGATLEIVATDTTAASEDFTVLVKTMTAGQAAATSLQFSLPGTVYPQGHLFALTMSNAADTSNDITIAAGEAVDETGVWNMTLAAATTKQIDAVWAVGTGAGGINIISVANDTWYEVILIGREDTRVVDVMFSTTANRATLPTSYTHKRRIGWVRRLTGTLALFTQIDDYVTLTTQINDSSTAITATAAAITLTVPPSSIARFRATLQMTALALAAEAITVFSEIVEGNVTPAGSTGIASLGAGGQNATSASNDWTSAGHFELRVSSTSTIEHDSALGSGAAGTFDISTFGWIDHRRRMSAT